MYMKKFTALAAVLAVAAPLGAVAAGKSVNVAMTLEPPGLDPTTGAAAAIGQITTYNIYESLTQINENATVSPLLAKSWKISDDGLTYTFNLHKGVKFHDGTDFDSADVKFTYERNAGEESKNKRKKYYRNMASITTPDAHTVVITLKSPRPKFLFNMGESTAAIVGPESAATNATKPVGTGPYKFVRWTKADSVRMKKNPDYRGAASVKIETVTFKFISDAAAQVAAVIAGDIDLIPYFRSPEALGPFKNSPKITVTTGSTEGETILATNNKHPALSKLKVRQAIAHAINRKELIDGAMFGQGTPIGTHFAPHNPDYVDLVDLYPHDPDLARKLLADAGHAGLALTLKLPPVPYARNGGQLIAQQLNAVGFKIKIENVDWGQWLATVYKQKNYDLTIVSHVEPMDIGIYANPKYYYQYDNKEMQSIMKKADSTMDAAERSKWLKAAQRRIAEDAVNGYLFQLAKTTVMRKGLMGVWKNSPMFVNDMKAVSWK
jgi:peptide/nickel transport system substrate-binding protein